MGVSDMVLGAIRSSPEVVRRLFAYNVLCFCGLKVSFVPWCSLDMVVRLIKKMNLIRRHEYIWMLAQVMRQPGSPRLLGTDDKKVGSRQNPI